MVEQFSAPEPAEENEQRDWRHIRRAAASRKSKRPALVISEDVRNRIPEP